MLRVPLYFLQAVAGARVQIESVEPLEVVNAFEGFFAKWNLSIEGMKHNAFEQITQRHVVIFGQGLKHFEKPLFHPDTGLHTFDK